LAGLWPPLKPAALEAKHGKTMLGYIWPLSDFIPFMLARPDERINLEVKVGVLTIKN
jgi:hypothetical protein